MNEQALLISEVNDFIRRRGLPGTRIAEICGISKNVFRNFKCGRRLLTNIQAEKVRAFIREYDRKLNA